MKPAKFEFLRPATIEDAVQYLADYGEDAKIISGGQSLIPVLNMRLSTPKYLIDVSRIKELNYIKKDSSVIKIGALTRHYEVEESELVRKYCPLLTEGMKNVGHPQIRSRGTIGGSIAHADPSAELPCILSALRGEIVIIGPDGERTVPTDEFFLTYLLTSLEPTELVKEIRFPIINENHGTAFIEMTRRHGDFALVEVASVVGIDEQGNFSSVQLAVGGAGPTPIVLEDIEDFLIGKEPTEHVIEEAVSSIKDYLDPEGDLHSSAEYRIHLASVLTKRALQTAIKRVPKGMMA
ncbi:xanthine dehydrogenase family protein subunit M [Bacillus sp. ISL-53]|uniref:FAD binding domain-containing protein n=1 Tax=unclassified Bacillus (in: firmicutes) TaxID=185979 RepID=UPI001BE5220D|nr:MULTISPECIES: xanthine dehydrogenase family protein subunit M [unclassified Bacillus (in: firmicutes)]MBT2605215.1 xanthine dehydrogenase family protein subunit M [Bacillus sp. ISL-53]MBT2613890.1 xanthine dehydrogenase family protein subunit M [Bacillus sp. ISL-78]MBT2627769.1 xanthine dehydrogenase family protein subunit M [Bacillus sp. ISL-101]MBT2717507.1 xanthine dehydrogenase family protein subunit M [Bacillus sp. ISL-57]